MSSDQPFLREAVEEQLTGLTESLQSDKPPEQTRNRRLLKDLQQLYQAHQTDPAALERIRTRLLDQLEADAPRLPVPLPVSTIALPKNEQNKIIRPRRKAWHLSLVAAILVIGVLLGGYFLIPGLRSPSTSRNAGAPLNHPTSSQSSPSPDTSGLIIIYGERSVLYQNTLYVNSSDGTIHTYAAQNGQIGPTYTIASTEDATPTIADGILYVSGIGSTSAVRLSDGKLLWQSPFGNDGLDTPAVVNGVLYERSTQTITALGANDGKLLWQYHLPGPNEDPGLPVVLQGVIYFTSPIEQNPSNEVRLYALKAIDGTLMWYHTLGNTPASSPVTDGSRLYIYTNGSAEALQPDTGTVLWQKNIQSPEIDAQVLNIVTNGTIYLLADDNRTAAGTIYALQAANGSLRWHYQVSSITNVSAWGNVLYFGALTRNAAEPYRPSSVLGALRISDGHLLWQHTVGERVILAPTAGPGGVYIVTGFPPQEELSGLNAANGNPLWHLKIHETQ